MRDKMESLENLLVLTNACIVLWYSKSQSTVPHVLEIELGAEDQGRSAAWE
jgi:hypothetical protein